MAETSHSRNVEQSSGVFLMGWGGVIAVVLGIAAAIALAPLLREFVALIERGLVAAGMTTDAAILALYWLQAVAIGVGVVIAVAGSDERMDRLRGGVGNWGVLLRETLVVTGIASLWVAAAVIWEIHADTFNTYGNAREVPMVALLVLMIVGSIVLRLVRVRRGRHPAAG